MLHTTKTCGTSHNPPTEMTIDAEVLFSQAYEWVPSDSVPSLPAKFHARPDIPCQGSPSMFIQCILGSVNKFHPKQAMYTDASRTLLSVKLALRSFANGASWIDLPNVHKTKAKHIHGT